MPLTDLSQRLASKSHRLVITTHWNPDGDAIGSSLGLAHYLRAQGHRVSVIFPNTASLPLQKSPGYSSEFVHVFSEDRGVAERCFDEAEGLFSLDYNTASRVGDEMQPWVENFQGFRVMVDHHQEPDGGYDYCYSQTTKSSTAEMVFDFIESDGGPMDAAAADGLLMGLITDTGSFRFPSVSADTLRAASKLVEAGAESHVIHERLFESNPPSRVKLWGRGLTSMELLANGQAALLFLTAKDLQECGYEAGDTEGLVNQGLGITGVRMAIFAREDAAAGIVKLSFRSKGEVDVNAFARSHWHGGGHIHAAGGKSDEAMESTLARLRSTVNEFLR